MTDPVLLCTVGGSHQPIVKVIEPIVEAIKNKKRFPGYVCFFCTGRDDMTGHAGSIEQVEGKGLCVLASRDDKKPTLPNIPAQAGLPGDRFEVRTVPADDLGGAYSVMREAVADLAKKFSGARFIFDYTGGTKTMTAALVCTALERDDADLQLVSGARDNLSQAINGMPMKASADRLRFNREMARHLGAWRRFAYHEAAEGLDGIRIATNAPASDREKLMLARVLSRALACWDDFDHESASEKLKPYRMDTVAQAYPWMLPTLGCLAGGDKPNREPARLLDLWHNAERRAAQGRFDDAVGRWYRLMEWTAQWRLRVDLEVDTADFPPEHLPPGVKAVPDENGKIKIGLRQAWQVIECSPRLEGPAREFARQHGRKLFNLLDLRNDSILAHGFKPIGEEDWKKVRAFAEEYFLPVLRDLARKAGLKKHEPQQLPKVPPESILEVRS